ncbi:hypothetical protein FRC06_004785, partial [Ceratobasidium sp. 370]
PIILALSVYELYRAGNINCLAYHAHIFRPDSIAPATDYLVACANAGRPLSITFPSPTPMTILDSSTGEDWIVSPSSLTLLLGRSALVAPSVAEVLPPGLEQPVVRAPAFLTLHRSTLLSSVHTVSSFSDVSPPWLLTPSTPEKSSLLYRIGFICWVYLNCLGPAPSTCPSSFGLEQDASQSLALLGGLISASIPPIRDVLRIPAPSAPPS